MPLDFGQGRFVMTALTQSNAGSRDVLSHHAHSVIIPSNTAKQSLQGVAETLEAHADDEIVLGVWLPGTASDLLAGARALPDADGWSL